MAPVPKRCEQHKEQRCLLPANHVENHHFDDSTEPARLIPYFGSESVSGDLASELAQWWRARAESEIEKTVGKATEYSGLGGGLPADLVDLGRQIAFVQRREHDFTDAELAEIGVWSYLQGKLNRWSSALRNGRMVSDDTLLDIGVYVRIAQRIRDTGQWP